jgi:hypothetical protein
VRELEGVLNIIAARDPSLKRHIAETGIIDPSPASRYRKKELGRDRDRDMSRDVEAEGEVDIDLTREDDGREVGGQAEEANQDYRGNRNDNNVNGGQNESTRSPSRTASRNPLPPGETGHGDNDDMLLSMDMHVNDAGFNDGMQMDMMDMGFQPFSQEGQAARQIPDSHQQPQQQTTAYPSSNMSAYFPPRESVSAAPQSQSQSHEPTRSVGGGNGLEGRQHSMPRKNIGLFGQGIPMSDEENMYDRYDVGPTGTSGSNAHMPSTSFCGFVPQSGLFANIYLHYRPTNQSSASPPPSAILCVTSNIQHGRQSPARSSVQCPCIGVCGTFSQEGQHSWQRANLPGAKQNRVGYRAGAGGGYLADRVERPAA